MSAIIAVDAGGTTTRAICIDPAGRLLGVGFAGSGNPTSVGQAEADRAVITAISTALDKAATLAVHATGIVCAAGEPVRGRREKIALGAGFANAEALALVGDSVATFHSASDEPAGFALVVGTGAAVLRIDGGEATQIVDGEGWLLGDSGSGYWIGHQIARSVAADLGGRGPETSLTARVLATVSPSVDERWGLHRGRNSAALMSWVYDHPPTNLAVLAPLAFEVEADDEVAQQILHDAESALAATARRARGADRALPLVGSGSVLRYGFLKSGRRPGPLGEELADAQMKLCSNGIVGAGMLALRRAGFTPCPQVRTRLADAVASYDEWSAP